MPSALLQKIPEVASATVERYTPADSEVLLKPHGGYLVRLEDFERLALGTLCRRALAEDGSTGDCSLRISAVPRRKILRLAFAGPSFRGRSGARWYRDHHALARLLSLTAPATVHAYAYDPEEGEEVSAYGNGRRVGGERLLYADVDLPDEREHAPADLAFERMKERWPLGHLATVFGISRRELLELATAHPVCVVDLRPPRRHVSHRKG